MLLSPKFTCDNTRTNVLRQIAPRPNFNQPEICASTRQKRKCKRFAIPLGRIPKSLDIQTASKG